MAKSIRGLLRSYGGYSYLVMFNASAIFLEVRLLIIGHDIHRSAYIGMSYLNVKRIVMG